MKSNEIKDSYINDIIKHSWTWDKLTEEERNRFLDTIYSSGCELGCKGISKQRRIQIANGYSMFLRGVGYTPFNWRE